MKRNCARIVTAILLLVHFSGVWARTITVCTSGCEVPAISLAAGLAVDGDVIDIQQAVITERGIVLDGRITVTSSTPQPAVVQAHPDPMTADDRVFFVSPSADVTLRRLTIRHGVFEFGAGIFSAGGDLALDQVTMSRNGSRATTLRGGAIQMEGDATLTIIDSDFSRNRAVRGGAIYATTATINIERSSFADNDAFEGGALYNPSANINITNSTFFRNIAPNGGAGLLNNGGQVVIDSATFSENSIRAIQNNGTGLLSVRNSILGDSYSSLGAPDADCAVFVGGVITDEGNNLVENVGSCTFSHAGPRASVTIGDPQLTVYGNWGGSTPTIMPAPGSLAIDRGNAGTIIDQRQFTRLGRFDDIGAVEAEDRPFDDVPPSFLMTIEAAGERHYASFEKHSVRNAGAQVQQQNPTTGFTRYFQEAPATYYGALDADAGSTAAAVILPDGQVFHQVILRTGTQWVNEGTTTEVRDTNNIAFAPPYFVPEAGVTDGTSLVEAQVGVDIPFHIYDFAHRRDPERAVRITEYSILAANLIYARQVGIVHALERLIIRSSGLSDPYADLRQEIPNCGPHCRFLQEVTRQWTQVLPTGTEDVVAVLREVNAGAGLGFIGAVGGPGFSSNDVTLQGNFSDVWRHEVGHNWSIGHFDGGNPEGPTINSGNALSIMSGPEAALVANHRVQRASILDPVGPFDKPIPPHGATDIAFVSAEFTQSVADRPALPGIRVLENDHDANDEGVELLDIDLLPLDGVLGGTAVAAGAEVIFSPPCADPGCSQVVGPTSDFSLFRYRLGDTSQTGEARGLLFIRLVNFVNPYVQNFNGFTNGTTELDDGSFVFRINEGSVAATQDNALELTPDGNGQYGGFAIPMTRLQAGFRARFRYNVSAIGQAGEAFSINFGQRAPDRRSLALHGYSRGVTVEFNTFRTPGYRVHVNGQFQADSFVSDSTIADGAWHTVDLFWVSGRLSLIEDGQPILSNYQVPAFQATADDWVSFSAITSNLSQRVLIDDVEVERTGVFADGFEG